MEAKEIIAKVKRLEIRTRKSVNDFVAGAYHSVFKGKGIEFDEVREYVPGDEIRDIDWNVTARMNKPYVKRFVEERQLTVLLLVDVSRSLQVPGRTMTKIRMATELAALLAFGAIRNGDRVGLILFSEGEELHLRPKKGRRHGMRLIREMVAHQPVSTGTNLTNALNGLMQSNYRRSIVFLISDFMDDGYEHALKLVAEKHDLVAFRLIERSDYQLPDAGLVVLENAEAGDQRGAVQAAARAALSRSPARAPMRSRVASSASRQAAINGRVMRPSSQSWPVGLPSLRSSPR